MATDDDQLRDVQSSKVNPEVGDDDQQQTRLNSDVGVFMHLLKASIGSGILFLPHAFSNAGYATALMCAMIAGLISCYTAVLLVQCTQTLCKRSQQASLNFADAGALSFKFGPKCIRKYSDGFGIFVNTLVCFVQYQTTVVYALYIATSFQQIIEHFSEVNCDVRVYVAVFSVIFAGLALIPNFKYLVPVSIAGTALLMSGLIGAMIYFLHDFPDPGRLVAFTDLKSIPIFSSIYLFAVYNTAVILPLENNMKKPENMTKILTANMIGNIFIYIIFGFLGYNKYLDSCDTVIKNLPLDHLPAQLIKVVVTLSVICTYALQYHVPVTILWPLIAKRIGRDDYLYEMTFRLLGVILSSLLAIAVPQMISMLGLLTAVSMTTVMLLIPIIIEFTTMWNYDTGNVSFYTRIIKEAMIFFVWIMTLIFGVLENAKEIVRNYSKEDKEDTIC